MISPSTSTIDASGESASMPAVGISVGKRRGGILLANGYFRTIAENGAASIGSNAPGPTARNIPTKANIPFVRHSRGAGELKLQNLELKA